MKINHKAIAASSLFVATILFLRSLTACPFCLSPPQTFVEQMSRADIVVIAELLRFRVLEDSSRPESTLRIREVLRGKTLSKTNPSLAVGQVVIVDKEAAGNTGDLFLMYGDLPVRFGDSGAMQLASDSSNAPSQSTYASVTPATFSTTSESSVPSTAVSQSSADAARAKFAEMPLPGTHDISKSSMAIPELISWNDVSQVSETTINYLRRLPEKSVDHADRLRFYLNYLEYSEPIVAIDAWAEFGNSTYEQVKEVRKEMPREKLRAWIAEPTTSPERLGLYGMMLGLCGEASDADFLLSLILDSPLPVMGEAILSEQLSGIPGSAFLQAIDCTDLASPQMRIGSEGLLGGYLLLAGEQGLDVLDQQFANSIEIAHIYCLALQFIWQYEPDLIARQRLRLSMRSLLRSEQIQPIAITNLCRWEDWTILPHLQSSFDSIEDEESQRAVIEFSKVYLRAIANKKVDESQNGLCEAFLANARMTHPQLFSSRFGDFGPPKP